jgi:hypothetical protein
MSLTFPHLTLTQTALIAVGIIVAIYIGIALRRVFGR